MQAMVKILQTYQLTQEQQQVLEKLSPLKILLCIPIMVGISAYNPLTVPVALAATSNTVSFCFESLNSKLSVSCSSTLALVHWLQVQPAKEEKEERHNYNQLTFIFRSFCVASQFKILFAHQITLPLALLSAKDHFQFGAVHIFRNHGQGVKRTPEDNTIHHPQYIFEIDLTSGSLMLALVLDGGSVSHIHCRPTCSD